MLAHAWGYSVADEATSYTPPTVPGTSPEGYTWDKDSLLASLTNADGSTTTVTRDSAGRAWKVTSPWATTTAAFDSASGQLSTLTRGAQGLAWKYDGFVVTEEKASGPVSSTVGWRYDAFLRPTSVSVNASAVAYGYDDDGLLTSAGPETLARDAATGFLSSTTTGAVTTQWSFNGYGEVASLSAKAGATALYSETLSWDDAGRLTGKTEVVQGVSTVYLYGYDDAGRLVSETKDGSPAHAWSYDDNGNRTVADGVTSTFDAQDRLLSTGAVTYTHDAFGNRTSRTDTSGTTTYVFDGEAHLLSATLPSGTKLEYLYDSRGRRVGKKRNGVLEKGWVYDGQWRIVAEFDGSGAVTARFIYGELSHSPDLMAKGGTTYRLVHDFLGSVRLVVDASTGAVAQRLDYDAWGGVSADSAPGFQAFGFAGGLRDADTSLIRFGARDYDPSTGRWTSHDPIGFAAGSSNTYAYAGNRPSARVDPSGLATFFGLAPIPGQNLEWWSQPTVERQELDRVYSLLVDRHWQFAIDYNRVMGGGCLSHAQDLKKAIDALGLTAFKAHIVGLSPAPGAVHYQVLLTPSSGPTRFSSVLTDTYLWPGMSDFEPEDWGYVVDYE